MSLTKKKVLKKSNFGHLRKCYVWKMKSIFVISFYYFILKRIETMEPVAGLILCKSNDVGQ